jgi:hypothetical protein
LLMMTMIDDLASVLWVSQWYDHAQMLFHQQ